MGFFYAPMRLPRSPTVFQHLFFPISPTHKYRSTGAVIGFTVLLALIGASGSFVWTLFGSVFCKFFSRHTKAINLVMALLLVYCAVALFL